MSLVYSHCNWKITHYLQSESKRGVNPLAPFQLSITHNSRNLHGATCGREILLPIVEAGMPLLQ